MHTTPSINSSRAEEVRDKDQKEKEERKGKSCMCDRGLGGLRASRTGVTAPGVSWSRHLPISTGGCKSGVQFTVCLALLTSGPHRPVAPGGLLMGRAGHRTMGQHLPENWAPAKGTPVRLSSLGPGAGQISTALCRNALSGNGEEEKRRCEGGGRAMNKTSKTTFAKTGMAVLLLIYKPLKLGVCGGPSVWLF